jgi:AraC family transcriptional regulator, L-rhamnose operon regulatory protein RhaS
MSATAILDARSGSTRQLSTHRNAGLEVVYVERGELLWHIEGVEYRVNAGSVFYTFPWENHGSLREFEPGHHWYFFIANVGGSRAFRKERLDPVPVFGTQSRVAGAVFQTLARAKSRCFPANDRFAFLLRSAVEVKNTAEKYKPETLRCIAQWCLMELAQCASDTRRGENFFACKPAVRNFLKKLPAQLEQKWTLQEMAAECELGRTQFANTVRILTGDAPMEHLQRLRIERSRHLLRHTGQSITDIAMECGFASSQHFARIFKNFSGQSASDYRSGNRSEGGQRC